MLRFLLKLSAWVGILIGTTFVVTNGRSALSDLQFAARSTEVAVTIIGMDRDVRTSNVGQHRNEVTMYRPVVSALDADGAEVRHTLTSWYAPKPFDVGDVVSGRYDPTSGEIVPDILRSQYGLHPVEGIVGPGLLAGLCGWFLWRTRRRA